jgi:hypothetical protein
MPPFRAVWIIIQSRKAKGNRVPPVSIHTLMREVDPDLPQSESRFVEHRNYTLNALKP